MDFSRRELINIAIGIEKQGIAYYDVMAISTWHEIARDLFQHLTDMERQHVEIFENMLSQYESMSTIDEISDENAAYIKGLINSAVFTDEMAANELATHIDNEDEALDIAIGAEKDSILFYYNLQEMLSHPDDSPIKQIINEEKLHLSQLSKLKEVLLDLR